METLRNSKPNVLENEKHFLLEGTIQSKMISFTVNQKDEVIIVNSYTPPPKKTLKKRRENLLNKFVSLEPKYINGQLHYTCTYLLKG